MGQWFRNGNPGKSKENEFDAVRPDICGAHVENENSDSQLTAYSSQLTAHSSQLTALRANIPETGLVLLINEQ
jgi:hypothetical protein